MEVHIPCSVAQAEALMLPGPTPFLLQPSHSLFQLLVFSSPSRPALFPSQSLFGLSPPLSKPFCLPSPPPSRFSLSSSGAPCSPFRPTFSLPGPSPSPLPLPLPTSSPAPAVLSSQYQPLQSHLFTKTEHSQGLHKVTHKKIADRIIEHPRDVIVEYPVMLQVSQLPISSTSTPTHSIILSSTFSIYSEMGTVDMMRSFARCYGVCQADPSCAQSSTQCVGLFTL